MIRKSNFSLVELLVVISIIAVLMGILIPAVNSMKEKGRQTKARAEINALVLAIKNYESTYGILPLTAAANNNDMNPDTSATVNSDTDLRLDDTSAANITAYDRLIQWLTQVPTQSGGGVDMTGNLRRIKFLDPAAADGSKTYLDPWGNRYVIIMDANYNGVTSVETSKDNVKRLYANVLVYSLGRNKIDNDGLCNGVNANSKTCDDIGSWHK